MPTFLPAVAIAVIVPRFRVVQTTNEEETTTTTTTVEEGLEASEESDGGPVEEETTIENANPGDDEMGEEVEEGSS